MASAVRSIPLASGTADVAVRSKPCVLMGYSIRENAAVGAVATVIIRDGTDDTGAIVVVIELAADSSKEAWYGPQGKRMNKGIFVDRVAGTTEGAIDTA